MSAAIGRVTHFFKAIFNHGMDKAEDKNTEAVVDQAVRDARTQENQLTNAVASEAATAMGLRRQEASANQDANGWHEKAALALKNGDEALAKTALAHEQAARSSAKMYGDQAAAIEAKEKQDEDKLKHVHDQVEAAAAKGDQVKAQHKVNDAEQQVDNSFDKSNPDSAISTIDRLAENEQHRTDTQQAKNDITGASDEQKLDDMKKNAELDDALAQLKQEVGGGAAAPAAPAAAAPAAAQPAPAAAPAGVQPAAAPATTDGAVANQEGIIAS